MTQLQGGITTVFDADNHYWESSDAFTRYRDPKFMDRVFCSKKWMAHPATSSATGSTP